MIAPSIPRAALSAILALAAGFWAHLALSHRSTVPLSSSGDSFGGSCLVVGGAIALTALLWRLGQLALGLDRLLDGSTDETAPRLLPLAAVHAASAAAAWFAASRGLADAPFVLMGVAAGILLPGTVLWIGHQAAYAIPSAGGSGAPAAWLREGSGGEAWRVAFHVALAVGGVAALLHRPHPDSLAIVTLAAVVALDLNGYFGLPAALEASSSPRPDQSAALALDPGLSTPTPSGLPAPSTPSAHQAWPRILTHRSALLLPPLCLFIAMPADQETVRLVCMAATATALLEATLLVMAARAGAGSLLLALAAAGMIALPAEAYLKAFTVPWEFLGDSLWFVSGPEGQPGEEFAFRGRPPRTPKGNVFRVMVLGASAVYGAGLPDGSRDDYPTLLNELIPTTADARPVEVLNCGLPGYTSELGLDFFKRKLLALGPDLLIVSFGTNDIGSSSSAQWNSAEPGIDRRFIRHERWLERHTWLAGLRGFARASAVYLAARKAMVELGSTVSSGEPPARVTRAEFWQNLGEFTRLAAEHGFRLAFTYDLPDYYVEHAGTPSAPPPYLHELRQMSALRQVPLLDARRTFQESGVPLNQLYFDAVHMRPAGMRLFASGLAAEIRRTRLLESSREQRTTTSP